MRNVLASIYGAQHRIRQRMLVGLCRSALEHEKRIRGRDPAASSRIVVILTGLVGDSVMCTPALAGIRRGWPEADVRLVGQRHNLDLLRACPHVNGFKLAEAIPFTIRRRAQLRRFAAWLASEAFDLALVLLGDEFAPLLWKAGIPTRVGPAQAILSPFFSHTYDIGSYRTWGPADRAAAVAVLGKPLPQELPELWPDLSAWQSMTRKLSGDGVALDPPYLVFHPFGRTEPQRLPRQAVEEVSRVLSEDRRTPVFLVGGVETRAVRIPSQAGLHDLRGRLDLAETVALISRASVVISTDSGPLHIAGALRRRTVGLFRARRPEYSTLYPTVVPLLGKNPRCEGECTWDECAKRPCRQMQNIGAAEIVATTARLLCEGC